MNASGMPCTLFAATTCVVACFVAACQTGASPAEATLSGTATYRERMALPTQAVFEATLEDVSRADAASEVLGRTRLESPGNPPIRFSIKYDPARIQPAHRYAVRARILVGDDLLFSTDQSYPVLDAGQPVAVDLMLRRVGGKAGRGRMRGMYSYMADAGWFVDCATGNRMPVAQEGENAALEAAYVRARSTPGEALLATVEGRVETREPMEGPARPMLIVERVVEIAAQGACDEPASSASLENTYWKLSRLGSVPTSVGERQSEPHFILQPGQKRVTGSGGCNRFTGSYTTDGERIEFGQLARTMMACVEGMEQEGAFHHALARVAHWRIAGGQLELFDANGESVAQFESRHMQ